MSFARRRPQQLPVTGSSRAALAEIYERGGEHELRTKLREAGGDDLFVAGMVADLGARGWCETCHRANSPTMYRLYAQIAKAVDGTAELAAQLMAALTAARPAHEAMENARGMSRDDRRARMIEWLARDEGVPESVMRNAVDGARHNRVQHAKNGASSP